MHWKRLTTTTLLDSVVRFWEKTLLESINAKKINFTPLLIRTPSIVEFLLKKKNGWHTKNKTKKTIIYKSEVLYKVYSMQFFNISLIMASEVQSKPSNNTSLLLKHSNDQPSCDDQTCCFSSPSYSLPSCKVQCHPKTSVVPCMFYLPPQ